MFKYLTVCSEMFYIVIFKAIASKMFYHCISCKCGPTLQGMKAEFKKRTRDNVFKNGPSKICGRQSLKNLKWHGLSI